MSNEVILCVWDQLTSGDVIYSFSNLNTRFNSLLIEFHGLYKKLDLRHCSLSACRFFCRQVPTMMEWRLGLTVLKIGNHYRCSQTDMFADEVRKSVVASHFARSGISCNNSSKDIFRILMTYSKSTEPIFPQLVSLVVFESISISEETRDALLFAVAGGSSLRTFTWNASSNQTYHSRAFFDWLFRFSMNLSNYKLQTPDCEEGFELKYEHTIMNAYVPHRSLASLTISVLNLNTLHVLLHYLPQLEYLDVYIIDVLYSMKTNDEDLPTELNYPKKLCVLHLSNFKIAGPNCSCLNQLVDRFANTLEEFSLFLTHHCNGELDVCFDGYRLATLCSGLSHLRSLHFGIQLQFIEPPSSQIMSDFIQAFRTPFWLNGPLGCIRVCVNYHQVFRLVQMSSLPYVFSNNTVFRTIDLIDILFNTSEAEKDISNHLPIALRSLWSGMETLCISLFEKQKIPTSFIHALQCPSSHNKVLLLLNERGILPNNLESLEQLTHFSTLQLKSSFDTNSIYDFQHQNEEIMVPLLSFVIDKQRFRQLQCLRFILCKSISSAWRNIHKWIDFVFTHTNQHQLKCLRFDFIEKEQQEVIDMKTGDEIVSLTEPPCIADIHRFVSEKHIAFWIHYKY
ncbi:unnamed protein product [Rotaria magnacalcarata]